MKMNTASLVSCWSNDEREEQMRHSRSFGPLSAANFSINTLIVKSLLTSLFRRNSPHRKLNGVNPSLAKRGKAA